MTDQVTFPVVVTKTDPCKTPHVDELRDALSKCQKLLYELTRPDANKPYNSMTFWAQCVEAETYARSIVGATK